MNVDSILKYKSDPNEDFYAILGCDASASTEQILVEYKIRAKTCHPDKNSHDPESQERFQRLLQAKDILTDTNERNLYDSWRSAGIAMKYSQWRSMKDTVKSSMHWATPKTSGRMIDLVEHDEPISLNPSPVRDSEESKETAANENTDENEITYEATPYNQLGLRLETPPPEWQNQSDNDENVEPTAKKEHANKEESIKPSSNRVDSKTALRRRQFANRRESTIGAMVMAEKWEDNEIRRRFRNYEI